MKTCESCKYANAERVCFDDAPALTCHFNPPTIFSETAPMFQHKIEAKTGWPVVGPNDWCGQYKSETNTDELTK